MKFNKLFSITILTGLSKVIAQDCNVVKTILAGLGYPIDESTDCCNYSFNDQYTISCNGNSITQLSIVNNPNIVEIPNDILNLKSLEKLDFSNCQISQFPYKLKDLPNLKSLSLWKNSISTISEEISQFKNLEYLDLGENQLSSIPDSIGQMTNLNSLLLYNNDISSFPNSIYQLSKLKTLNVESNPNLSGELKNFGGKIELCNIKNTHICISKINTCNKYIVNNSKNMPLCDAGEAAKYSKGISGGSVFGDIIIIIGLLLLGVITIGGGYYYYKRSSNKKTVYRTRSLDRQPMINKNPDSSSTISDTSSKSKKSNRKHVTINV